MFDRILTRKAWTVEAREKALQTRRARAVARTANSQAGMNSGVSSTHGEDQPNQTPHDPTRPPSSMRSVAPEHAPAPVTNNHVEAAKVIMQQYGGNRFVAMTGAKDFTAGKDESGNPSLTFRIPRANGITHVKTVLKPNDTYSVHMIGVHAGKATEKHAAHDLYFDQLQSHFTSKTGLHTRL